MRSRSLAFACILGSGLLLGAAGSPRLTVLFQSSFDLSALAPKAELGSFQFKSGLGVSLTPVVGGGFAAMLGGVPQDVYLQGLFADGKAINTGELDLTFTAIPKFKGGFDAGVIIDEPTSAFYPTSGSGNDGGLVAGGVPAGVSLPLNTEIDFAIHYARSAPNQNWTYVVTVQWQDTKEPDGVATTTISGTLPNTANRKISGIGFFKPATSPAVVQIDDVLVTLSTQ